MAVNLELKIKISSIEDMVLLLEKIGAKKAEVLNQKDIYYENKIGLLKLRKENNNYKLIQYLREEIKEERWSHYEVLNISDEKAEHFLSNIFTAEAEVIKTRLVYLYENTRIHLDNVGKLGCFLELETVGAKDISSKREFDKIVQLLNINTNEQIKKSYKNLIQEL